MKRLLNETSEDYKKRRWNENERIKRISAGKLFWDSYRKGTYKKEV